MIKLWLAVDEEDEKRIFESQYAVSNIGGNQDEEQKQAKILVSNKHGQNEEQPKDFDLSEDHEFDQDIDEMSALENSVEN